MSEDLVHLLSLETNDIVDTLRHRFSNKRPYVMCGSVCISTNPHEHLPHLYTQSVQSEYAAEEGGAAHPYILVNRALGGIVAPDSASSHTLVVTGESGSGKTEMAKICLGYACGRAADSVTRERLERIVTGGQILEYVGNAQTTRNGNSSRFGKFLRVFYREGSQIGASVQTYLLERGRIAQSSQHEGTFRIVYAVIDNFCNVYALHALDRSVLGRPAAAVPSSWEWFEEACQQTGLTPERLRKEIVDPIVAILFLLVRDYANASVLLGVETSTLTQAIHNRRTTINGEVLWSECTVDEARHRCKALVMSLYQCLFARVVQSLNEFIGCAQVATATSLNILDIFGFESLETNGLEQLCINYCNERIQALFLADAIVAQRAEYQEQGIDVHDSAGLLERDEPDISLLCETKVFPMLDEAQRMPNSNAMDFVDAISSRSFRGVHVPLVRRRDSVVFSIDHYAGTIEYTADAFLERNIDELREEIVDVLRGSSRSDIRSLCQATSLPASTESARHARRRMWTVSVTGAFSSQMIELVDTIRTTTAHYIRCIRPNKTASTDSFDEEYVREQIRANGISQAAHVMRNGYTHRMTHAAFSKRFRRTGERAKCDKSGFHWGTTLVYLTAERYVGLRRSEAACAIQRTYARYDASRRKLIVAIRNCLQLKQDARERQQQTLARAAAAAQRAATATQRTAANAEDPIVALHELRRRGAVRAIQMAVKAHNARIFDRWKEMDDIGRLKAHLAVLRAEIRLKDAWIFQAQQQLRALQK